MMDVHCRQCATVFEFDERLMRSPQATLQCSVCDHVFSIESSSPRRQENQLRWMLRTKARGDILYFDGFDTLHRWIIERKVQSQDELSRSGEHWTRLEDVGEFVPIFKVVQSISEMMGEQQAEPEHSATQPLFAQSSPKRPPAPTPKPVLNTQRTSLVAPVDEQTAVLAAPPIPLASESEWTLGGRASPEEATQVVLRNEVDAAPSPSWGKRLAVLGLLLIVGGGVYVWTQRPDLLDALTNHATMNSGQVVASMPSIQVDPAGGASPSSWSAQAPSAHIHEALSSGRLSAQASVIGLGVRASTPRVHEAVKQAYTAQSRAMTRDIKVVIKRADSARKRQKATSARKLYHQALEIDPTNTRAIVGLGWSLLSLGRSGAAAAQFNKALHIDTGVEDAYIGLGKAERARGRLKEALSAYDRYLKRYPTGRQASIARYQRDQLKQTLGQ